MKQIKIEKQISPVFLLDENVVSFYDGRDLYVMDIDGNESVLDVVESLGLYISDIDYLFKLCFCMSDYFFLVELY